MTQEGLDTHQKEHDHYTNIKHPKGSMREDPPQARIPCPACSTTFMTQEGLDAHQKVAHPSKPSWYCSVCEKTFSTADEMIDHNWDLHHGCVRYNIRRARATFTCITCNRTYDDQKELDKHVVNQHTKLPVKYNIPRKGAWYCSACDEMFYSQCAVNDHNRDEHWGRGIFCLPHAYATSTCVACNRRFKNYRELCSHLAKTQHTLPALSKLDAHFRPSLKAQRVKHDHSAKRNAPSVKATLYCHECDLNFDNLQAFEKHTTDKAVDEPAPNYTTPDKAYFSCERCDKFFMREHTLDIHNEVEHNETMEKRGPDCSCCGQTFHYLPALDSHRKYENYGLCYDCNMAFRFDDDYDEHQRLYHAQEDTREVIKQEHERPNNLNVHVSSDRDESEDADNESDDDESDDDESVDSDGDEESDDSHGDDESDNSSDSPNVETKHVHIPFGRQRDFQSAGFEDSDEELEYVRCDACDKDFWGQIRLDRHNRAIHGPLQPATPIPPFSCISCRRSYAGKARLADHHRRIHETERRSRRFDSDDENYQESESEESSSADDSFDEFYLTDDTTSEETNWPSRGRVGYLRCPGRDLGCLEKFRWGSELIKHIESQRCAVLGNKLWLGDLFNGDMNEGRHLYVSKGYRQGYFQCFHCPNNFQKLSGLIKHAESEICDLKIGDKHLKPLEDALEKYTEKNCKRVGRFPCY
ncbi:hypothetical protein FSHL1_002990 [Fusarium sambucinum]